MRRFSYVLGGLLAVTLMTGQTCQQDPMTGFMQAASPKLVDPVSGAVFTTDAECAVVNGNIYDSKDAVYIDGGPAKPGAAGLPDGQYAVQVTEPDGTLLGASVGSGNDTPVTVVDGEFADCYQLSAILIKASDGTPGYDTTSNPGGEYKVWVSMVLTFPESSSKTDNFKVKEEVPCPPPPPPPCDP